MSLRRSSGISPSSKRFSSIAIDWVGAKLSKPRTTLQSAPGFRIAPSLWLLVLTFSLIYIMYECYLIFLPTKSDCRWRCAVWCSSPLLPLFALFCRERRQSRAASVSHFRIGFQQQVANETVPFDEFPYIDEVMDNGNGSRPHLQLFATPGRMMENTQ